MTRWFRKNKRLIILCVIGPVASITLCDVLGIKNKVAVFTPGFNYPCAALSILVWVVVYWAIFVLLAAIKADAKMSDDPNSHDPSSGNIP